MIWKLLHWMFGWDYIQWENFADSGIARIHVDGKGRPYYWRYKNIGFADIIVTANQVLWLTCEPQKYNMGPASVVVDVTKCQCVDCHGDKPNNDPTCEYMRQLHGAPLPDDVAVALTHINDVANEARRFGDYTKANALVRARATLARAIAEQPAGGGVVFNRCPDDGSLVSNQGHRLAYGGVPGCWRVKPEDFPPEAPTAPATNYPDTPQHDFMGFKIMANQVVPPNIVVMSYEGSDYDVGELKRLVGSDKNCIVRIISSKAGS